MPARKAPWWDKLIYAATSFCFLALFATGLFHVIVLRERMTGYLLYFHVTVGGVFAVCLLALTMIWAEHNRFEGAGSAERFTTGQKFCFWTAITLGLVSLVAVLLCMVPLFGLEGLEWLYQVHRYSAFIMAIAALWHTCIGFAGRKNRK